MQHRYAAHGLCIASDFAVPWLPAGPDRAPDVTVRRGAVPAVSANQFVFWEASPGAFHLEVDGLARFRVTGGTDILVEPVGEDEHALAVALVGSPLAVCLQQRGVLTLHASALDTAAGAVLFLGHPGAGKSTLLAALVERGYAMLADDLTGVFGGPRGQPRALPAFPCVRLWMDTLDMFALGERTAYCRVRPGMDKYLLPVDRVCNRPRNVRAAYVLVPHNLEAIELRRVGPGDAVARLALHTYQRGFLRGLGLQAGHFSAITALAGRVPVADLTRPRHVRCIAALADRVERDVRRLTREARDARPATGR